MAWWPRAGGFGACPDAGERPRASLGRAPEDAGGDGDKRDGGMGERARYHMRGAG